MDDPTITTTNDAAPDALAPAAGPAIQAAKTVPAPAPAPAPTPAPEPETATDAPAQAPYYTLGGSVN